MRYPGLSILSASIAILLALAGCSADASDAPGGDAGELCRMVLSVDLSGTVSSSVSRTADPADFAWFDYEDAKWGKPGENFEQLRIIILDGNGDVEYNRVVAVTSNSVKAGEYEFEVRKNDTKTVIIVANEGEYNIDVPGMELVSGTSQRLTEWLDGYPRNSHLDLDELKKLTLALDRQDGYDSERPSLPKNIPATSVHEGIEIGAEALYKREFPVHRAAVKYSFNIINRSKFPHRLTGLRIDKIANRELLIPDAVYRYDKDGRIMGVERYTNCDNVGSAVYDAKLETPLVLPVGMTKAVTVCAPVYVPEGETNKYVAQKVSVSLDGAELEEWRDLMWFMPEDILSSESRFPLGQPMVDLPRNTHVIINITITDNNKFSAVADVQPYAEVVVRPPFGLDRDEEGNVVTNRYPDGTYDVLEGHEIVRVDVDGDRVLKTFKDKSILCKEVIYKDYIHDNYEIDYEFYFEKDAPGGNMVIIREHSSGGQLHADVPTDDTHQHDNTDRPLFVLDKKGDFYKVRYADDGTPELHDTDSDGAKILQATGYQFRIEQGEPLEKYIGTYLVLKADGTEELRYYKNGQPLDMELGTQDPRLNTTL